MDTKQENIKLEPMQRFWRLLKPDKRDIQNVYIYSIFNGLFSLSLPLGIQAIINLIQGGQVTSSWILLVLVVVLGIGAKGVLKIFQLRITENLQQRIFTRAAFEFAYRIPRIKLEALYRHYAPELMNRFFDTMSVQKGLSKILINFSEASLQIIFGLILLSFYHPFFIVFSLILILLVYAIFRFTGKKGLTTSLQESKHKYQMAFWLEEMARTSSTFKLAGRTDLPLKRTDKLVGRYLGAREAHFKVLVQQYSLMVVFNVLVATGLLAIGGILVMEQLMNIGQFVAAEIIILLILNSVEKLIFSFESIYDVLTALEKLGNVTDLDLDSDKGVDVPAPVNGHGMEVKMETVRFSYPGEQKDILKDIDLHVGQGEKLTIVGPNGSGKSTLLQIIAGLYPPKEGNITYNGMPRERVMLRNLHSRVGDSLSAERIFHGTVMENIRMGREAATTQRVEWAVNNLGLTEFIHSLPEGYDTLIEPQGSKYPKGVVQKILLARSIADEPELLLLEEPLEHLDGIERIRVTDFLFSQDRPWTAVTASSNPYLLKNSHRIAIMRDGKIWKQGNFEELLDELKAEKLA